MPTSKLEAELVKATKVKQAQAEPRSKYLVRLLHAGQSVPDPVWDAISAEAQHWYNESVRLYQAHNNPNDIKEFPDLTPAVQRVSMKPVEAVEEPKPVPVEEPEVEAIEDEEPEVEDEDLPIEEPANGIDGEEEEEEDLPAEEDEDGEEEMPVPQPEPEPVPLQAAKKPATPKPKPAPAKPKPAVKTPSRPPKPIKAAAEVVEMPLKDKIRAKASAANGETEEMPSRPPKPAAPGASTMIKRLLLKDSNITNAELMEHLKAHNIAVTSISVSTIRSDFRHSLKVLHEAGYALEIPAF